MFKPDERYLPVKPGTYQTKESVEYLFSKVSNTREHWQKIVDKLKGIYCWSDDLQTSWFEINMQGTIEFHGEGCGYIGKDGTIDTIPKGLYNFWDILNQVQNTENREKFLLHPFTLEGKLTGVPSPWSFIQDERGVVSLKYTAPNVVDWLRQLPGIRFNNTTGRVNDVMGWNPDLHDTPEKAFTAKEVSKETKLSFKHFIPNSGVVEKGYEFQFTHHNVDGSWNIASYSNDRVRIENPYGFTMPNIDLENASYNSTVMPGIVPNTFTWKSEREARLEDLKRKVRAGFLNATARVENKYRLEINNNFDNPMAKFTVKLVNPVFYTAGLYPGEYTVKAIADGNFIKNITSNQDKSSRNPIGDHFNRGYISGHNDSMDTPDKVLAHYKSKRLYFKVKFTHKETGLESDIIDVPYSALTRWEKDSVYDVTDEIMARENQWNIRLYAVRNVIDVNPDGTPVYKLLNQFLIDNLGHPGTYKIKTDFNDQPETSREHILVNYDKLFNQLTSDQREHWNQIKYKLVDYAAPNGQGPFPFFMNEKTFTAQPSDTATYAIKEGLFPNPQYSIIGNAITTTYPDGRVVKEFKNIKIQISGHKPGRWKIGVTDFYYGDVEIGKSGEALVEIESLNKAMIDRLEDDYHLGTEITVYSWNDVEIQPQETRQITQSIPYHEFIHFNLTESNIQAENPVITRLRNMLNNVTFHALKRLDFLQSTTRARPTYEITLPSNLPSGRYKFRLGTTEITSNGNTNKLSITNAEDRLDRLYQDGTKLTLVEYNGAPVTNIVSTINFTETRRYLKAAIKPLTDNMYASGSLEITENGRYDNNMRMNANDSTDTVDGFYRMEVDGIAVEYEAYANGNIDDGLPRVDLNDRSKPIVKTWDPETKPTIPVRMLSYSSNASTFYDLYEDEAAMNANRKGYTVQIPNRITYTNNQAIVDKTTRWFDELTRLGLNIDYVCTGKEGDDLKFNMYAYAEGDSLSRLSPGTVKLTTTDPRSSEYEFEGNAGQRHYLFTDTDITKPYQDDYTRYTNPTSRTMRLVQVNRKSITPIVKNIPIRRTRYFMDVSHLESLTQASMTGTVAINGTRQAKNSIYSGNIEFSNIAKGHYLMEYTLNGNQSMTMNVERDPQRIPYSLTINNFDGSSTNNIPARFTKFSNMPIGQYNSDNGSFNARPLSFSIRNNLTVKDNVAVVEEAKAIMESLKSKSVFVHQLLEDFDNNERARFEQRVYVPRLRNAEDRNIQVRVVGESNTVRLPLTDKPFTMANHPWVNKPNGLTEPYVLAKPNTIQLELVSVDGIAVPGNPRYDIRVSGTSQYVKHSALVNRVENLDITGPFVMEGSQEEYKSKINGNVGKTSYSKLPSGQYEVQFTLAEKANTVNITVNRSGNSTSGSFVHVNIPSTVTYASLPRTIQGSIPKYRQMYIEHDTQVEDVPVSITLDNRLTLDDKRTQPMNNGDLVNKPVGNAKFDTMWNEADMRVFLVDVSGNVDQRSDRVRYTSYLKTFRRLPKGRYEMSVLHQSYNTPENGHINLQQTGVLKPQSNEYEGRAWAQPYGIEKVTEMNFIGTPPSDDRWKKASIMIPYKKIDLTINSKNKPLVPVDRRLADPFDQYRMVLHVFVAITSYRRNQTDDKYAPFVITSYIEFDQVSLQAFQKVIIGSDEIHFGIPDNRQYIDKVYCPIEPWIMDMSTPGYNKLIWVNRNTINRSPGTDTQAELVKELMIPRKIKAKLHVEEIGGPRRTKDVQIPIQFHILNADDREYNTTLPELILPRFNRKVNYSYK